MQRFNELTKEVWTKGGKLHLHQQQGNTWLAGAYSNTGREYQWASGVTIIEALERLIPLLDQLPEDDFSDLA